MKKVTRGIGGCLIISRALTIVFMLVVLRAGSVTGQSLDHFTWSPPPVTAVPNQPIPLMLQAQDASNNVVTNFNGSALLTVTVPQALPNILITEVESINDKRVEISNVSTNSVDVSGWRVVLYD